jgi:Kef-type K+ transport system membrane component KefB/mannitol/fructose-specific phosphotransferase system IIA component (Ntr-type)/nucleotide-binding universal stress UspA family protein
MEITDPVLMFAFIMAVILAAPALFERLKLPGIIGLIITGIIIGPHAFGIIKSADSIQLFSSVGLIYIMFLAGLEINLNEFTRQKKNSISFGMLTFMIPMIIGTLGSRHLFSFSWPTAILLASMFASHTLISFPITSRLGINRERFVVATIGGTIFTDTAAMLILAIIAESVSRDLTALFWVRQLIFLLLLIWFALWLLPRIAYFFFKILAPDGGKEFILTLTLVFLTAHFAHLAGVEPIIGAFFAGLSLSRLIPEQSPLKNRLEFVGNTFFIPFFLISVGMLVNLQIILFESSAWAIAAFMCLVAIFCKYLAAFIFAKISGFTKNERNLIFGLSVNQAAATLAAVIVGLRLGIFNEAILNGTIFMIFITCLIGPWFTEKYGQDVARKRTKTAKSDHKSDGRIIVAVSKSESAELLTDLALSLWSEDSKEPISPLYVVQDGLDIDRRVLSGEKVLGEVVNRIVAANIPVSPLSRIDVDIPGGIIRTLKEYHADILVLGTVLAGKSNFKSMLFDISDKVSDDSRQLIFLSRMVHPLNIGNSVKVFIPPALECRNGFGRAIESIRNIAAKNKLEINVVGVRDTIEYAKKSFQRKSSTIDISFSVLDKWVSCSTYLRRTKLRNSDSIILMAARKGRLGWNPSLKREFYSLGLSFPENNIMMLYLPDTDSEQMSCDLGHGEKESGLDSLLVKPAVNIERDSLDEALLVLLESQFSADSKISSEITKKLFPLDPIELSSGIILFHMYSGHVGEPVILLGISKNGITSASLQKKIYALFILISPEDQTSIHLQALTKVAIMARDLENKKLQA